MPKSNKVDKPQLIDGGLSVDDRGQVSFVNDFNFKTVKRFYTVSNHRSGFIRAWHAHNKEAKFILVVKGAALVGAVAIDNWDQPSKYVEVQRYVLSESNPKILHIPSGYANGFMSLTEDTQIMFFSTSTLEESQNDDFRYDAKYWDIWTVEER